MRTGRIIVNDTIVNDNPIFTSSIRPVQCYHGEAYSTWKWTADYNAPDTYRSAPTYAALKPETPTHKHPGTTTLC